MTMLLRIGYTGLLCLALLMGLTVNAQTKTAAFSTTGFWAPSTGTFSPVLNKDHSITFRLKAPAAKEVRLLFGEWNIKPQSLAKDSSGAWRISIGPVAPGIYSYFVFGRWCAGAGHGESHRKERYRTLCQRGRSTGQSGAV